VLTLLFLPSKAIIKKDGNNTQTNNQQLAKRINSASHLEAWQVKVVFRKRVGRTNNNNSNRSIKQSNNSNSNLAFNNPVHIKVQDQHKTPLKEDNNNNSNYSTNSCHSNNTSNNNNNSIQRKQTALDLGLC